MSEPKLTHRQARFVDEYVRDLNALGAAHRAGFSQRDRKAGARLVALPHVLGEINKRLLALRHDLNVEAIHVRQKFAWIAFDPRSPEEGGPTVDQVISATRELGKLMGLYTERHHHTGGLTLEQLLRQADEDDAAAR